MTLSDFRKVGPIQGANQAEYVEDAFSEDDLPTLNRIDNHFRKKVEVANPGLDNVKKGIEILKAAGAKVNGEKPGIIDSEIQRVTSDIRKERAKAKPNWTTIDYLVRQLATLMLRKAGLSDQELAQAELDRMREDIVKVTGTYNNIWSLVASIGGGALGIVGGLIGVGGSLKGIGELSNGAAKVTEMTKAWQKTGGELSGLSQSIGGITRPIDSYYESKRRAHEFELQLSQNRRDAAQNSASQNRNMVSSSLSNLDRLIESVHTAKMRILGSTS